MEERKGKKKEDKKGRIEKTVKERNMRDKEREKRRKLKKNR